MRADARRNYERIVATALAAGILSIAMGLVTNYPFAMAAGLGINAIVAVFAPLAVRRYVRGETRR